MKRSVWLIGFIVCAAVLAVVCLTGAVSGGRNVHSSESGIIISNYDQIISALRGGLRNHSREITIRFETKSERMDGIEILVAELVEEALAETGDPKEGDYIRYQYGGYELRYSQSGTEDGYAYQARIIPNYYTYMSEEAEVDERVAEIIEDFGFDRQTTEYEKLRTIYDYVVQNVSYDDVHKNKENNHKKTTAYSALVYHTAVCQGYSVLVYRLCREAGVDVRVVTGTVRRGETEEYHAWNIVAIDGVYYNLDATLGHADSSEDYFLLCDATMSDRVREEQYCSEEFYDRYPMAEEDYPQR